MNIIEEQNVSDEHKAEDAGNTQPPTVSTSAKKVYSKPTLFILSSTTPQGAKTSSGTQR